MRCCLCGGKIAQVGDWKLGNDAYPLRKGRCCNKCDTTKVIPARKKLSKGDNLYPKMQYVGGLRKNVL